jgi:ribonuclease BN (tRNA processing enzyme)
MNVARSVVGDRAGVTDAAFNLRTAFVAGDDAREVNKFAVRSIDVPHDPAVMASARRLQMGSTSLVYSGDIGPDGDCIISLAKDANVLIHDTYSEAAVNARATLSANPVSLVRAYTSTHTEVRQVAARAQSAGVEKLVLTHLLDSEDDAHLICEASAIFSGEIFVARDGLILDM